ncbi:FAD/NAD(P)-binding domain-containing protein [Xylaria digitata]|nr:FAD/NAD(P)-binding domain-containing protein [Xylaria digitata]
MGYFVLTNNSLKLILAFLAESGNKVLVFQRTPSSVTPRENRETKPEMAASLRLGNRYGRLSEGYGGWRIGRRDSRRGDQRRRAAPTPSTRLTQSIRDNIDKKVNDKATAEKLKPWYPYMCKRPAFHNDYIATFNKPNVELIDTEIDLIVYSTGFDFIFAHDFERRTGIRIVGSKNQTIDEAWAEKGPSTLYGIHARDFPNMFNVGAMQAGVGVTWLHTCYVTGDHIASVVGKMIKQNVFEVIEPSSEASEEWGKQMEEGADYNREGKPEEVSPRCGPYPKGVSAWAKALRDWREEGAWEGFETR